MKYSFAIFISTFLFFFFTKNTFAQQGCTDPAYNQFDFWVGDWNVYDTTGDTIVEHNPVGSTWNQVWVDNSGSTIHFSGRFKDNVMQMYGAKVIRGAKVNFDFAFHYNEKDDTVRQVWKMSRDEGENWNTIFDGTYRKKKK